MIKIKIDYKLDGWNEIIAYNRTNKYIGAQRKKREMQIIKLFLVGVPKIEKYPIKITFNWYTKNFASDLDNKSTKAILDAMQSFGIIKQDNYKIGDIVTYKKNNGYITHRIIKINKNEITTKGDANNIEDESIEKKNIVGKVVYSGKILNIIIKYKYIIVCLLLSIYFFTCYFSKSDDKEQKQ